MPDVSFRVEMAGDVPVVVTPSDIDITSATVLRIFAITGLDQVISCFTSLDQALAAP